MADRYGPHILVRHEDEPARDRKLLATVPEVSGSLLVLASAGAQWQPLLGQALASLLRSLLPPASGKNGRRNGYRAVWLGIGNAGAADSPHSALFRQLSTELGVDLLAPDGTLVGGAGCGLYVGPTVGAKGWRLFRAGAGDSVVSTRYPVPSWERAMPRDRVTDAGLVAEPVPAGIAVRHERSAPIKPSDLAFRVVASGAWPQVIVGRPGEAPIPASALATLLSQINRQVRARAVIVPGNPAVADAAWLGELAQRLSQPVTLSGGIQLEPTSGSRSTVAIDSQGAELFWPFATLLRQPVGDGGQEVLDVAPAPSGWERCGPRLYRTSGGKTETAVVAEVVPAGLVLRPVEANVVGPNEPFDPQGWRIVVGVSGVAVDEALLTNLERLLGSLRDVQRRRLRVRVAGNLGGPVHARLTRITQDAAVPLELPPGAVPDAEQGTVRVRLAPASAPEKVQPVRPPSGRAVLRVPSPLKASPVDPPAEAPPDALRPADSSSPGEEQRPAAPSAEPSAPGRPPLRVPRPSAGEAPAAEPTLRVRPPVPPAPPAAPAASSSPAASSPPGGLRVPPGPAGGPPGARPSPMPPSPMPPSPMSPPGAPPRPAGPPPGGFRVPPGRAGGPPGARPSPVPPPVPPSPPGARPSPAIPAPPGLGPNIAMMSSAPVPTVSGPPSKERVGEPQSPAPTPEPVPVEPPTADPQPVDAQTPTTAAEAEQATSAEQSIVDPAAAEAPSAATMDEPARPAGAAPVVITDRTSTSAEQARFTAAAGDAFTDALATVNAALATWPALRHSDAGAKADYVAVCLYLGRGEGGAVRLNERLRTGSGAPYEGYLPCLVSGLRRLPTHRRPLLRQGILGGPAEQRYPVGSVLTVANFLSASVTLDVTVPGADLDMLIWPYSARRTSELGVHRPIDEALFVAGRRFKALAVRTSDRDSHEQEREGPDVPRTAVLVRELSPDEVPGTSEVDSRDQAALAKLERAWARRQQQPVRALDDPDIVARLTNPMVDAAGGSTGGVAPVMASTGAPTTATMS